MNFVFSDSQQEISPWKGLWQFVETWREGKFFGLSCYNSSQIGSNHFPEQPQSEAWHFRKEHHYDKVKPDLAGEFHF